MLGILARRAAGFQEPHSFGNGREPMEGNRASSAYAAEFTSKRRGRSKPITAFNMLKLLHRTSTWFWMVLWDFMVLRYYNSMEPSFQDPYFWAKKSTITQRRTEALLPQGPMWWHLFQVGCISSTVAPCRCARWDGRLAGAPLEASEDAKCHRDGHREHGQQWSKGTDTKGSCRGCHQQQGDWPKPPREASSPSPSRPSPAHRHEFYGTFGAWCDANGGLQHCRHGLEREMLRERSQTLIICSLDIYIILVYIIYIYNVYIYIYLSASFTCPMSILMCWCGNSSFWWLIRAFQPPTLTLSWIRRKLTAENDPPTHRYH